MKKDKVELVIGSIKPIDSKKLTLGACLLNHIEEEFQLPNNELYSKTYVSNIKLNKKQTNKKI